MQIKRLHSSLHATQKYVRHWGVLWRDIPDGKRIEFDRLSTVNAEFRRNDGTRFKQVQTQSVKIWFEIHSRDEGGSTLVCLFL